MAACERVAVGLCVLVLASVAFGADSGIRKMPEGAQSFGDDSIEASTMPPGDASVTMEPEWSFHQGDGKIIDKSAPVGEETDGHPKKHLKVLDNLFKDPDPSKQNTKSYEKSSKGFGANRADEFNEEEFDEYEALSHVPYPAVHRVAMLDGSQNATYFKFMDAAFLEKSATFKGPRAHFLSTSQATDIARQEKIDRQTGRLDFGVGGSPWDKMFELQIAEENQLEEAMDYVVRIHVMAEDLTADNDLSIGLSNGEDVLFFMRMDRHNKHCGAIFAGHDDGDRITNAQQGPKTGKLKYTAQQFEVKYSLDHQQYAAIMASCGATATPALWSPPKKFDKTRPLKLVVIQNDRGEKYGIYGINVSIHREGTFNRFMTGEWLFHHATQPVLQKRQGVKWELKKERLVIKSAQSAKQKILEVPLVPGGAMLPYVDYSARLKVYTKDLTEDNDLTVGLTDGVNTIAFQRVDSSSDYGGLLLSLGDGDSMTSGLTFLSKSLLMERKTQRVFDFEVRLGSNVTYASAGSSIAYISASYMTDKPLDKTRGLSLVVYRDDGAESYAIYGIDFQANVGELNQLFTSEYIWQHGRVSNRRSVELVNAGKRGGSLDKLPPATGLLFRKGGDTDYEVLLEQVVVAPNTMAQSQTYSAVIRGYVGTGDHGLVIGLTDGHNIAGVELASAASDATQHNTVVHRPFWDKYNYYDLENVPESFGPPNSGRRHERGFFEVHIGFGGAQTRIYTNCDAKVPSSGWLAEERLRPEEGLRLIVVSQQPKFDQTFYEATVHIRKEGSKGGADCPKHCSGNGYCAFHKLCIQKHPDRGPIYEHCPLTPAQPKPRIYEPICSCDPNWSGNDCSMEKDTPRELYNDLRGCKMITGIVHVDEFKPKGVVSADMKEAIQKFGLLMTTSQNTTALDEGGQGQDDDARAVADAAIKDAATTASAELNEIFSGKDPEDDPVDDLGPPAADYQETDPTFEFNDPFSGGHGDADVDFGEVEFDKASRGDDASGESVEDDRSGGDGVSQGDDVDSATQASASDPDVQDEFGAEFNEVFQSDPLARNGPAAHSTNHVNSLGEDAEGASGELSPVGSTDADQFSEEINKLGAELKQRDVVSSI